MLPLSLLPFLLLQSFHFIGHCDITCLCLSIFQVMQKCDPPLVTIFEHISISLVAFLKIPSTASRLTFVSPSYPARIFFLTIVHELTLLSLNYCPTKVHNSMYRWAAETSELQGICSPYNLLRLFSANLIPWTLNLSISSYCAATYTVLGWNSESKNFPVQVVFNIKTNK